MSRCLTVSLFHHVGVLLVFLFPAEFCIDCNCLLDNLGSQIGLAYFIIEWMWCLYTKLNIYLECPNVVPVSALGVFSLGLPLLIMLLCGTNDKHALYVTQSIFVFLCIYCKEGLMLCRSVLLLCKI